MGRSGMKVLQCLAQQNSTGLPPVQFLLFQVLSSLLANEKKEEAKVLERQEI